MNNRYRIVRSVALVACVVAVDAAVALAADPQPTSRPAAAAPSTQPALVGGSISSDYARPTPAPQPRPVLTPSQTGGSSVNTPATVTIGAGVDAAQGDAAAADPPRSVGVYGSTTRPAGR